MYTAPIICGYQCIVYTDNFPSQQGTLTMRKIWYINYVQKFVVTY